MGRGRKTEAEQGIDQVNRRGPSVGPHKLSPDTRGGNREGGEVYADMYRLMTSPSLC